MKHLTLNKISSLVARFVAILVLGSVAMTAQAQEDAEGNKGNSGSMMVGFKTGFNISEFRNNGALQYWSLDAGSGKVLGAQVMGFFRYQANPWLAGDLELGYAMQGAQINAGTRVGSGNATYRYNTHGVQANLLANVRLPIITVYKPKFFVGPSLGYNFYVHEQAEGMLFGIPFNEPLDATENFEAVDFGMVMGLEFEFDLKFASLLIDARYRHGFNDLNNMQNTRGVAPALEGNRSAENSGIAINFGLGFPIGGK